MNREDIIRMADASGLSLYSMGKDREKFIHYLERFAALVASAEREACALLCYEQRKTSWLMSVHWDALACADAIRAGTKPRGQA